MIISKRNLHFSSYYILHCITVKMNVEILTLLTFLVVPFQLLQTANFK